MKKQKTGRKWVAGLLLALGGWLISCGVMDKAWAGISNCPQPWPLDGPTTRLTSCSGDCDKSCVDMRSPVDGPGCTLGLNTCRYKQAAYWSQAKSDLCSKPYQTCICLLDQSTNKSPWYDCHPPVTVTICYNE